MNTEGIYGFFFSCRQEREAEFAQKKAERATIRCHFREKYKLPKVNQAASFSVLAFEVCLPVNLFHLVCFYVLTSERE